MNSIYIIADAIRTADGDHTMGASQLAEVAVKATCEHIAEFRTNDTCTSHAKGWNDAISAILTSFGHGDLR